MSPRVVSVLVFRALAVVALVKSLPYLAIGSAEQIARVLAGQWEGWSQDIMHLLPGVLFVAGGLLVWRTAERFADRAARPGRPWVCWGTTAFSAVGLLAIGCTFSRVGQLAYQAVFAATHEWATWPGQWTRSAEAWAVVAGQLAVGLVLLLGARRIARWTEGGPCLQ